MSKITTAFVGAAHIHTPGFINTLNKSFADTVSAKYVYDHDLARAEKSAAELPGATATTDLATVVNDPDVSAVIVCSETNLHEELVLPLIAAKKHVFIEKPIGIGASDAYKIADAVEAAGLLFQTGYFSRGMGAHLFLKQAIADGKFGTVTRARGSNCHSGALGGWFDGEWRWMADPAQSGVGGFGDLGTHKLDILLWLLGDVARVTAQLDNGTARYPGCDEWGEGLIRFESGVVATLAAGWNDIADPVQLEIAGTEGHAVVFNGQLYLSGKGFDDADGKTSFDTSSYNAPAGLDAFLNALVTGEKSPALVTVREAAYRSAVMEAMYEAANSATWVSPQAS